MAFAFLLIVLIYVNVPMSTENDNRPGFSTVPYMSKPSVNCLNLEEAEKFTMKSDPLKERCEPGSEFVRNYCRANDSHHSCSNCKGQLLPNLCFCDIGQQCNNDDAPRKKTCSWCKDNCPCLQNGTCICDTTGDGLYCKCPKGYNGKYCENIPVRICKTDQVTTELEHCKKRRNETCFIDFQDKSKLKCTILKEVNKSIPNCSSYGTEITISTKDHIVSPNTNGGNCFLVCFELIVLFLLIEFCKSYVL